MSKKAVLLFSILLLAGLVFFFAGDPGQGDEVGKTLSLGSLAGEVRQAEHLFERLPDTLDTEKLRLCFRGEELACDRETKMQVY